MPEVASATIKSHLADGTLIVNTIHYEIDITLPFGWGEPDMNAQADAVWNTFASEYRALIPTTGTVETLTYKEVLHPSSSDIPREAVKFVNLAGTRSLSVQDLKPALCAVVDLKTSYASRSARGWLFAPPALTSGSVSGSALGNFSTTAGAYYPLVQAWAAKLDDNVSVAAAGEVGGATLKPRVYSRTRHGRDEDPYVFPIVGTLVSPVPRWLRSRNTTP